MDAIGIDEDPTLVPKIGNGCLPLVKICLVENPMQVFREQIGEIPFHGLVLLLPLQHGALHQDRVCNRDWNRPAKAGRTRTKIRAHSTATKRASGSPLGAIKAWKIRMLTITGASTATASGTYRLASKSTPAMT